MEIRPQVTQPELEWAAKTWTGEWWKHGGGAPWDGILYDPDTDLVIFGTGNGSPWPAAVRCISKEGAGAACKAGRKRRGS